MAHLAIALDDSYQTNSWIGPQSCCRWPSLQHWLDMWGGGRGLRGVCTGGVVSLLPGKADGGVGGWEAREEGVCAA